MKPRLVIATGFLDDNWHSMRVVAEGLHAALGSSELFAPRLGRMPRWYDRRLLYGGKLPAADTLHVCDQSYGDALFKARERAGLVTATVHDIAFWRARSPLTAPFRRRIRDGLAVADALVASSSATARDMSRELGLTAARVIALGTDLDRYPHVEARRVPGRLLMVGSSMERKGVDRALRLLARLPAPFHLVKVGEALTPEQAALAARLGVAARVEIRASLSDAALPAAYAEAAMLLFPSRYEGYGMPPVEARLCGTPALVSPETPVREFLEKDPGTVVFPFRALDEGAETAAIESALALFSTIKGDPCRLPNREWYGWARVAREYIDVWDGIRVLKSRVG